MEDLFKELGEFVHGVLHQGRYHKTFVLEEEVMEHTLRVSNDGEVDFLRLYGDDAKKILGDDSYYSAFLLAKRLTVEGVEKVTPEMVLRLSRKDGQKLLFLSSRLEQRRELFREEAAAPKKGHPGPAKDRLSGGGDPSDEPRENQ